MDDTTKRMCNQLHEAFYATKRLLKEDDGDSSETSDSNQTSFTPNDSIIAGYITDINKHIGGVNASYDNLLFNDTTKRAQWSGNISGEIDWSVVYSNSEENGVYFTIENSKLSTEQTKAIHKLNLYFETTWFAAIRDAILKKELSK